MDLMLYGNFYQLMRNRLLADRMVAEQELGVTDAKLVVVAPEGNSSYREGSVSSVLSERCRGARTVEEVMQAALKNPDRTLLPSHLPCFSNRSSGSVARLYKTGRRICGSGTGCEREEHGQAIGDGNGQRALGE